MRIKPQNNKYRRNANSDDTKINEMIKNAQVRLIGVNGEQIGVVSNERALRLAQEANVDLVEIAGNVNPPVCKLLDYGKFRYEKQKKEKQNKKKQHIVQVKEIRLRPSIGDHDLLTKLTKAQKFILDGCKLKFTVMFRGRELGNMGRGTELLGRVVEVLNEIAKVEKAPETEGRRMILIMGPK